MQEVRGLSFVQPEKNTIRAFSIALGIFAIATAIRYLLLPFENQIPYLTYYPAVAAAFYFTGKWPGRLTVALCAVAGASLFISANARPEGVEEPGWIAASFFAASALVLGWVVNQLGIKAIQLQESQRRFQWMLESQTEFIVRVNAIGEAIYVNDAFCELLGVSRDAILGTKPRQMVLESHQARVNDAVARLTPGDPKVTIEYEMLRPDGSIRWCKVNVRADFDTRGRLEGRQSVGRDITERKLLETQLEEVTNRFLDLYEHAPCGYYSVNADGVFVEVNALTLSWLGVTRNEALGKLGPVDFFTDEGKATFNRKFPEFMLAGMIEPIEFDLLARDGTRRRVSVTATAILDSEGRFQRSRSVMYDITEMHSIRSQLKQMNHNQEAMLDNELVGIVKLRNRVATWTNKALEKMFGYDANELLGQSAQVLYPDEASFNSMGNAYAALRAGERFRTQIQLKRKDGELIWVDVSGVHISADTSESLWMLLDITEIKSHQQKVEFIAMHDALTGLPNRRLLFDRLDQCILLAGRSDQHVAVCYLDLDGFKSINDLWGHEAGDAVLIETAGRLLSCVRASDTVARLGGDEFVVVIANLNSPDDWRPVLNRILKVTCLPIRMRDGHIANVSCSIGIASFPRNGSEGVTLINMADQAMLQAKKAGKNQICVCDADSSIEA